MGMVDQVEAQYSELSRQERKVALIVTQSPEAVQQMTISDLAKSAGVSTATITRFAKKMGCQNFYAFKLQLAESNKPQGPNTQVNENDPLADQVYNFYQKILTGTWQKLDTAKIKQAVTLITKARRLYLFGLGSSGYTANEMTQRLLRMGIAAFCMTDSHIMYISSGIVSPGDVVLAISLSGYTSDVNQSVRLAQSKGAKIISITADDKSPLAQLSDLSILVKNSDFVDNTRFVNSQFAIIYALDIITTSLLENDTYRQHMNQTVALITNNKLDRK